VSEDQWGDLECLYKACQAARTDGGLFTDTGKKRKEALSACDDAGIIEIELRKFKSTSCSIHF